MKRVDKEESRNQVATTHMQLAGARAQLRVLGKGLRRTSDVIGRAVAAYQESKQLLAQIEMAERGHARQLRAAQPINDGSD